MDYEKLRKIIHLFGFIALVYYLIPVPDIQRDIMALVVVLIVLIFEFLRIVFDFNIPLFRNYEKDSLSGFGWCAIGLILSFILFPKWVNIPVVVAWAWIDPFIGYYRKKRWGIPAALLLYTTIFYLFAYLMIEHVSAAFFIMGPLVAIVGVWSEMLGKKEEFRWLNDDLTMVLFPAAAYFVLAYLAGIL